MNIPQRPAPRGLSRVHSAASGNASQAVLQARVNAQRLWWVGLKGNLSRKLPLLRRIQCVGTPS